MATRVPTSEVVTHFMENTSAHGIRKLRERTNWCTRLIWLLLLLAATCLIAFQLWQLVALYLRRPVTTKTTISSHSLNFPSVTLCNLNPFKYSLRQESYTTDYIQRLADSLNVSLAQFEGSDTASPGEYLSKRSLHYNFREPVIRNATLRLEKCFRNAYKADSNLEKMNISVSEFLYHAPDEFRVEALFFVADKSDLFKMAQPPEELIVGCMFAGKECDHRNFSYYYDMDYLTCYQFPNNNNHGVGTITNNNDDGNINTNNGNDYNDGTNNNTSNGNNNIDDGNNNNKDNEYNNGTNNNTDDGNNTNKDNDYNHGNNNNVYGNNNDDVHNNNEGGAGNNNNNAEDNNKSVSLPPTVFTAGQMFGLSLILNVDQKEYLPFVTPSAGVRVAIHEHGTSPNLMQKGQSVAPGFETSIGIRSVIRKQLPEPHGNCVEGTEYSDIQAGLLHQQECQRICLEDNIEKMCECTRRLYNQNNFTRPCERSTLRCYKCQRFGHRSNNCKVQVRVCPRCSVLLKMPQDVLIVE